MEKITSILSKITLFRGLNPEKISKISSICISKYYSKGEMIFLEKDKATGFYIIIEGKIKIFKTSMEGKEQILHIYESGNVFGEVHVFGEDEFPSSIPTLKKSHVLFLQRKSLVELITKNPLLSMNIDGRTFNSIERI